MAKKAYDSMAHRYDLFAGYEAPHISAGLLALNVNGGERVVELGCGTGKAARCLSLSVQPDGEYIGLDISEAMLGQARARLEKTPGLLDERRFPTWRLLAHDITQALPLAQDGLADSMFMSFCLELIDTPLIPVVLAHARRGLREGGRLVVVCLSRGKDGGMMQRLYEWAHEAFPRTVDCRPIDPEPLLKTAGFEVVHVAERSAYGLPVQVVTANNTPPSLVFNTIALDDPPFFPTE